MIFRYLIPKLKKNQNFILNLKLIFITYLFFWANNLDIVFNTINTI